LRIYPRANLRSIRSLFSRFRSKFRDGRSTREMRDHDDEDVNDKVKNDDVKDEDKRAERDFIRARGRIRRLGSGLYFSSVTLSATRPLHPATSFPLPCCRPKTRAHCASP